MCVYVRVCLRAYVLGCVSELVLVSVCVRACVCA